MSEHKKNVPKIRFPGFTNAWEQRRLGELARFSKGSGYTKNDLAENGSPIVLYGRLYTKYETIINEVDTFVEMKDKSVISEGNEVVVPASGETAEDISRASVIGRSGLILGGDLNIIKPNQEIDSTFLALTISNGTQQKEMSKCAQGKSIVHLHNSDLKQMNLLYPKLEEQQRIGKFFLQFDNLITLHQRKLNNVKNLKAGLLQKMFPKNGEDFPEVRFTGFTNAWEQRKFSDLVIRVSKSSNKEALPRVEYEDIISGRGEFNKDIFSKESDKKGIEFEVGDTLFGKLRPYLQNWFLADLEGIAVGDWWVLRPNEMDSKFIYVLIQSNKYQIVANLSTGTKMPRSDWKVVSQTKFAVPMDIDEQTKIGQFFGNLDHIITLHQRKLEHLQEQKKSLLQQMFV